MKRLLPFLFILIITARAFAQPVAVNDTIYYELGETITFNPLLNDYDNSGLELKIDAIPSYRGCDLISYNDTSVTFKLKDYLILEWNGLLPSINYRLENDFPIPEIGVIYLLPKFSNIDTLEANQIRTPIYPMNMQFWDAGMDGEVIGGISEFHYPKDSLTRTIFNASLWIGGKTAEDELHLAAERYRQGGQEFWPGPLSADGNATTDSVNAGQWFRTWKVSREEVIDHIANFDDPDYQMPEAIENWPAHGDPLLNQDEFIAPFVDVDQDMKYEPENGDYPFIKGDVTVFFVYNDQLNHSETQGEALGIEVHCMAWALEEQRENEAYNSTIFYSYKIINRSSQDYYDTYLGVFTDLDLGYAMDDYVGCHVENGNFYVYNGKEIDGNGDPESFGEKIPSQSVCILGGPFMDEDGIDNPAAQCNESINGAGFGDGEVDNERFGMNRFSYFSNTGPSYATDPQVAAEYYNIMRGVWKDGTGQLYGGNGHSSSGGDSLLPARFMFPGDSDSCHWGTNGVDPGALWTEETAGNQYGDRRGMASMGSFTFEAGSVEYLDIAYVTAPYTEEKSSKDLLQDYVAEIKDDYLEDPLDFGFQYTAIEELAQEERLLQIYPNPVEGDQIWFELEDAESADYRIYNTAGQLVQSGILPNQKQQKINIASLKSSWYLLEIKSNHKTFRAKLIK